MGRIRSIHPGFYTDENYVAVSMAARCALPGIWTECDDNGVFEWKPVVLKMKLFPADNVDMAAILAELVAANWIKRIEVEGKAYGLARNFRKYQRPEKPKIRYHLPDEDREYVGLIGEEEEKTFVLRKSKHAETDGKCYYCGEEVTYYAKRSNTMELDHMIPVSRGGTDAPDNFCCSCRTCNRAKHDRTAEEFIANRNAKSSESGATNGIRNPKPSDADAKRGVTPQREEGGGKREDEGGRRKEEKGLAAQPGTARDAAPCLADEISLEERLRKAAGWSHDASKLKQTGPIQALIDGGAILETDVLPTVRARAPDAKSRNSWAFFVPLIAEAYQKRVAAGRLIETTTGPPVLMVPIIAGSPEMAAWLKFEGKRSYPEVDLKDATGNRLGRGWYKKTAMPPERLAS